MEGRAVDVVELSVDVEASAETVWDMVGSPRGMGAMLQGEVTFDRRAGGPFRAEFPNFGMVIAGDMADFDPEARRVAMTWGSEQGPQAADLPAGSTLVELQVLDATHGVAGALGDTAPGCSVALRHSGFPSPRFAQEHDGGWRFHLGRLALQANRRDLAAGLGRTLPVWFAAWNEPDGDARLAALRTCCAEDMEFRDDWAAARGLERLNVHIANCHRFMPGWRIEAAGDLRICRGEALAGWRSSGPGGDQKGHNHVRASHDGTIRRVTGFAVRS